MLFRFLAALRNAIRAFRVMWAAAKPSAAEAAPAGSASSGSGRHYAGPVIVPAADGRSERVCWVRDDDELQRLGEFHVRVVEICTQRGGCA